MTTPTIPIAALDDYHSLAFSHFSGVHPHQIQLTSFQDTILPSDDLPGLIKRLEPFTVISTMRERTPFPRALIQALPNLKLLLTTGMRNAAIDMDACKEAGIPVIGTTGSFKDSGPRQDNTVQHTWALILALTTHVVADDAALKTKPYDAWQTSSPSVGLPGKTLGVVGLGRLGTAVARIAAAAFGMKVLAWSSSLTQEQADEKATAAGLSSGTFEVAKSKEEVLKRADVLTVHYVLSPRSKGLLGEQELALLKPTALLVNTSRGPLIDERALLQHLKQGKIKAAAFDVFDKEPLPSDSEWRTTKWGKEGRSEVVLSPHMAYVEENTMNIWYQEQAESVRQWMDGEELSNRIV